MAEKTKVDLSNIESTDIVYGVYNGKELLRECNTRDSAISYAEKHSATSVIKKRIGITNEGVKIYLDENLETCWEHCGEYKDTIPENIKETLGITESNKDNNDPFMITLRILKKVTKAFPSETMIKADGSTALWATKLGELTKNGISFDIIEPLIDDACKTKDLNSFITAADELLKTKEHSKIAPAELEEELHQSLIDKEDFVDTILYEAYKTAKEQITNKDFDKLLFIRNLQEEIENYLKTDSWKLSESYFKEKYNEISNSNIFNVSVAITNKIVDRVKFDLLN